MSPIGSTPLGARRHSKLGSSLFARPSARRLQRVSARKTTAPCIPQPLHARSEPDASSACLKMTAPCIPQPPHARSPSAHAKPSAREKAVRHLHTGCTRCFHPRCASSLLSALAPFALALPCIFSTSRASTRCRVHGVGEDRRRKGVRVRLRILGRASPCQPLHPIRRCSSAGIGLGVPVDHGERGQGRTNLARGSGGPERRRSIAKYRTEHCRAEARAKVWGGS